jgi:hypothetical protein
MRLVSISITAIAALVAGLAVSLSAQPARALGPCEKIRAACEAAGFRQGGASSGTGLQVDCVIPIMQGIAQPAAAARPLPQVAARVVAACKERNSRFGQPRLSTSEAQVQELPAGAARAVATPAPVPLSATTVPPMPALTSRAPGTGPYAVEIETTSGNKTAVGNAAAVTFRTKVAVIQFAQDNQQAQAVNTCFMQHCILDHVTITQTMSAHVNVYNLTTVTVLQLARTNCAGPATGQPCEGPILASFAFQKLEQKYLH